MDGFNRIGTFQSEACQKLMGIDAVTAEPMHLFQLHMKMANLYRKENNLSSETSQLKNAVQLIPQYLLANHRLAIAFEKRGKGTSL